MLTVKRLYFYGVLAIVGLPLLLGIADLVRLILQSLFDIMGVALAPSARLDREAVSLAVALVLVGAPLWGVHAWLLRRSSNGSGPERADELASWPRAIYFFAALVATLWVTLFNASDVVASLARALAVGQRADDLPAAISSFVVFGSAWLVHVAWRRRDLRLEPARTADDWSTRLYLYGALFALASMGLVAAAESLTVMAHELSGMRSLYEGPRWWQDAIAGSLGLAVAAAIAWLVHMGMGVRLTRAPSPMGQAHRAARSRIAYFVGVSLLGAIAVLISLGTATQHIVSGALGTWESVDGSRFEGQAYGSLAAMLPFAAAWWYHLHRASVEALDFGGVTRQASVVRAGRLLAAFVGLAGLSFGVAYGIGTGIDLAVESGSIGGIPALASWDDGALGLSAALVGLLIWLPFWRKLQRERAHDPVEVVASTVRRAYLLLVSGFAVVAAMASLSWIVYQLIRVLVEAGQAEESAWAIGALFVAAVVLTYHLLLLRSDRAVAAAAEPISATAPEHPEGAVEELVITGPPAADFEPLNASIRSQLPKGYQLRVVPKGRGH